MVILEDGGEIDQEICLFDSVKGEICFMWFKEEVYDYCYFLDLDLLLLEFM